jgi:hypothetical protein
LVTGDEVNLQLISQLLESPTKNLIQKLLDDQDTVFWVDWREEDGSIIDFCESIIQTGILSAKVIDVESDGGFELYIYYGYKQVKVPLSYSKHDRHITLCSLNAALKPDYEVRFCKASAGNDTLAFLPLPSSEWQALENRYGKTLEEHFYRFSFKPNLFTETLPFTF